MQEDSDKAAAPDPTGERLTQFQLLATRRLAPLFVTQFFGAFNDNLFKFALLMLFAYGGLVAEDSSDFANNAAAALFILPFFLFSATAGELSDRYEKSRLIRLVKISEICVAFLAGMSLYFGNLTLMLVVLFLFGLQSTFFGPLKFSILPQHLHQTELVGGNAMIESGTFVAILLGTLVGASIGGADQVTAWLFVLVMGVAVVGWLASRHIPVAPANAPEQRVNWNPFTATWHLIALSRENRAVFLSILGISWFWLIGGVYLAQVPNLTREYLGGGEGVVTLILAVFTVAIGTGSLLCERLSGRRIEIGLVPFAAFGISATGIEVYFATTAIEATGLRDVGAFLAGDGSLRVLIGMLLTGIFGGMYVVPLMAFIQARTPEERRARIIAAANIINSLFMVVGAGLAIVWLTVLDRTIPELFALLALINIGVAVFHLQPRAGILDAFSRVALVPHHVPRDPQRARQHSRAGRRHYRLQPCRLRRCVAPRGRGTSSHPLHHVQADLQHTRAELRLPHRAGHSHRWTPHGRSSLRGGVPRDPRRSGGWRPAMHLPRRQAHPRR